MTMQTASPGRAAEGADYRMTQAWQWLCEQRTQAPAPADVWDIRWQNLNTGAGWLTDLTARVLRGEYRLTPLQLHGKGKERKAVWSAQDALVLRWAALSLQHQLPLHPSCEHVKGHGGGKPSIEKLHGLLTAPADPGEKKTDAAAASTSGTSDSPDTREYKWVCRTDIRGYYRNINKQTLIKQVNQHVTSPVLRDLVQQYIHYTVEDGGTFRTPEKGISRGCPLSPLMGALHLYDMDEHFSNKPNIHYARYMDDVIILAKSRWSLRKHTKRLMQWFSEYGFEAHPDKTHIGRIKKGFDWMGAWLTHEGVTDIAPRAKANHREKVRRLYEQLARLPKWKRKSAAPKVNARVSAYRKRWNIWALGVLSLLTVSTSPSASISGGVVTINPQAAGFTPATTPGQLATAYATKDILDLARNGAPISAPYLATTSVMNTSGTVLLPARSLPGKVGFNGPTPGASVFTNPTLRACGLGFATSFETGVQFGAQYALVIGPGASASKQSTEDPSASYRVNKASQYVNLTYLGAESLTTCPAGTFVAAVCTTVLYSTATTTPAPLTAPASSCASKGVLVTYQLGSDYNPPAAIKCLLNLSSPATVSFPDITPGGGGTAGTVLVAGPAVTGTMSCNNSVLGDVPVNLHATWATTGPDFNNAGFNGTTATYVGLLAGATNAKSTAGTVISDADLLTDVSDPTAQGAQNFAMTPVVIAGTGGPLVGAGTVVGTLTAVVR